MNAVLHPFSLQLTEPVRTADGPITRREGFLLEWTDGPVTGLGEATPLPAWTEPFQDTEIVLTTARDHLRRGAPDAARSAVDDYPAARHAVDLAILDHHSRRASVPLHQYLGGSPDPDPIPINATIPTGSTDDTRTAAKAAADAGVPCVKCKVGDRDPAADSDRIAAVRATLPDAVALRVDANGAWTTEDVMTFSAGVDPNHLQYIEQPLPADDLTGHADLRDQGIPVALDEGVLASDIETVIDAGAADAVVLKPMAIGGIERTRSTAMTARDAGIEPVLSTTIDTGVARTAAAHITASLPDPLPAGLATADRFLNPLVPNTPRVVDGHIDLPEDNGNGVTLANVDNA